MVVLSVFLRGRFGSNGFLAGDDLPGVENEPLEDSLKGN